MASGMETVAAVGNWAMAGLLKVRLFSKFDDAVGGF